LELLGSYDPHKKNLLAKKERIEYWMSKGVTLSPTVNNLLVNNKIIIAPKMASWKPKTKPTTNNSQPITAKVEKVEVAPAPEEITETPVEEVKQEAKTEEAPNEDSSDRSQ
jgi:hypothetical protein